MQGSDIPGLCLGYEYDGAVMNIASHLPVNRNGFNF